MLLTGNDIMCKGSIDRHSGLRMKQQAVSGPSFKGNKLPDSYSVSNICQS